MGIVKLKNIACCAKTGLFLFLFTFHTSQIVTSLSGIPKFPNLFEITSNSQWNKRGSEPYYLFLECINYISIFSTYVFSASSAEERADWMEALEVCSNYRLPNNTGMFVFLICPIRLYCTVPITLSVCSPVQYVV